MHRLFVVLLLTLGSVHGSQAQELRVDASAIAPAVAAADYRGGTDRAPDGTVLGVTDRYLTLGGKPWIPVIGEMHYSRVPEADWDADLAKMKAAGVDVVSTYIIWIYHEEVQGQWDWTGNRDLRHFAELCRKHGLLLMVRVGPWAHAETRHGGLPDWVMQAGPVRQMDPKFLAATTLFYNQIGQQLHGTLWKDGGPVVGVQIENEYGQTGPGKGEEYILALKALALKAGLDVPFYTVTGWDNAVVPKGEFLPVFGGYPAAPWGGTTAKLPPQEVYAFRFHSRVSGNMGMIGSVPPAGGEPTSVTAAATPFLTAEIGGGIQDTYHRRPVMSAEDIAAMAPVMLGSGVNGYGSYMMVGGQNATGKRSSFQESQATGYPTDVPVKSYDFQAPIGEFGRERRSLRLLKEWNYFMRDFGSLLAPMPAFAPAVRPQDPNDLSVVRWSARTDGHTGFVFVNNYVRGTSMPARPAVQFTIALPQGRIAKVPAQPIDIPSGAFFAWPFGLQLGSGVELGYATAQLMARLAGSGHDASTQVLFCVSKIRCELSLQGSGLTVQAPRGIQVVSSANAAMLTRGPAAAALSVITIHAAGAAPGDAARIILLSSEAAADTWSLPFAGVNSLVRTSADLWPDNLGVALTQLGDPKFSFALYPAPHALPVANVALTRDGYGGFSADLQRINPTAWLEPLRKAGTVPTVHLGPSLDWRPVGVAQAPDDEVWAADAGEWQVHFKPQQIPSEVSDIFLRVNYVGDEARLVDARGALLEDNFWNGQPWLVGLRRFADAGNTLPPMQFQALPVGADAPVYFADEAHAALPQQGQKLEVKSVEAIAEFKLVLIPATGTNSETKTMR